MYTQTKIMDRETYCCGIFHVINGGLNNSDSKVPGCECKCGDWVQDGNTLMVEAAKFAGNKVKEASEIWNPFEGRVYHSANPGSREDGSVIPPDDTWNPKTEEERENLKGTHEGTGTLADTSKQSMVYSKAFMQASDNYFKELGIARYGLRTMYETMLTEDSEVLDSLRKMLMVGLEPAEIFNRDSWTDGTAVDDNTKGGTSSTPKGKTLASATDMVGPSELPVNQTEMMTKLNKTGTGKLSGHETTLTAEQRQESSQCFDEDQDPNEPLKASRICIFCALMRQCWPSGSPQHPHESQCGRRCRATCGQREGLARIYYTCKKAHQDRTMGVYGEAMTLCYGQKNVRLVPDPDVRFTHVVRPVVSPQLFRSLNGMSHEDMLNLYRDAMVTKSGVATIVRITPKDFRYERSQNDTEVEWPQTPAPTFNDQGEVEPITLEHIKAEATRVAEKHRGEINDSELSNMGATMDHVGFLAAYGLYLTYCHHFGETPKLGGGVFGTLWATDPTRALTPFC
jgi:hypothetical protein